MGSGYHGTQQGKVYATIELAKALYKEQEQVWMATYLGQGEDGGDEPDWILVRLGDKLAVIDADKFELLGELQKDAHASIASADN